MRLNTLASLLLAVTLGIMATSGGCRSCRKNANTIPAHCVPNSGSDCCLELADAPKINFLSLRRNPPDAYVLDAGDTLGIYIQGITGDSTTPPPVHFPEEVGAQPSVGYPFPIRDDGYVSLPLIQPVKVAGMTVGQAEARIRDAYTKDKDILKAESAKFIVTLMKRRTYNVLVIREDLSDNRTFAYRKSELFVDDELQGQTSSIDLPAYENDVLHALSETGGMPSESAKNEIIVLRGALKSGITDPNAIVRAVLSDVPDSDYMSGFDSNIIRIPVRPLDGMMPPDLTEADITLEDGDVVYIEGRQRDVFYTGGLLEGGRYPLPRDYNIDVLEAISMAGGSVASSAGSSGGQGGGIRSSSVAPATKVTIIRTVDCQQQAIEVDLRCAISDPKQRVVIQRGDLILLEYRPREVMINAAATMLQFGGIFRLIN